MATLQRNQKPNQAAEMLQNIRIPQLKQEEAQLINYAF
jgi:hypothetical protein